METGIAIIERNDTDTRAVFIDKETIEFARLNAQIKNHVASTEAAQHEIQRSIRAEQKAAARRKAYSLNAAKHVLIHSGIIGAVAWAGTAGMIHPAICIPVGLFSLCAVCLRLGAWFGRMWRK